MWFLKCDRSCVCCCSVAKSRPTLCELMDGSTPGSSVLPLSPRVAQIQVWATFICATLKRCEYYILILW